MNLFCCHLNLKWIKLRWLCTEMSVWSWCSCSFLHLFLPFINFPELANPVPFWEACLVFWLRCAMCIYLHMISPWLAGAFSKGTNWVWLPWSRNLRSLSWKTQKLLCQDYFFKLNMYSWDHGSLITISCMLLDIICRYILK